MQAPILEATPVNFFKNILINKSSEMLFQKVQQIDTPLINMSSFPYIYYWPITIHFTTYILYWASIHLLTQSLSFLQLQVFDQTSKYICKSISFSKKLVIFQSLN